LEILKKERVFYGALPYPASIIQMVSPPSSRVLYNTINFALSGDLEFRFILEESFY